MKICRTDQSTGAQLCLAWRLGAQSSSQLNFCAACYNETLAHLLETREVAGEEGREKWAKMDVTKLEFQYITTWFLYVALFIPSSGGPPATVFNDNIQAHFSASFL